jgi:hypothetical protein
MGAIDDDPGGDLGVDRVRQLTHDIRHCLYVLQQGLELLHAFRSDAAQFDHTLALLREERVQACKLVEELSQLARSTQEH